MGGTFSNALHRIFAQPPAYKPPVFDFTLLPPATGGQVLVLRGVDHLPYDDDAEGLGAGIVRYYLDVALAQGKSGPAALRCPLIVEIDPDASIELLDEAEMAEAGWYRNPSEVLPSDSTEG